MPWHQKRAVQIKFIVTLYYRHFPNAVRFTFASFQTAFRQEAYRLIRRAIRQENTHGRGIKMKSLFIIGNGFDIAHGLNTRYSDFMRYLLQYETPPQEIYPGWFYTGDMSQDDQERHALYEKITKYIPKDELWMYFEAALGNIDIEQIREDNSCYMLGYGDENWSDSANHDYQYMINEELNFTKAITEWFRKWIASINTKVLPKQSIVRMIGVDDIFLNFNYTDTLEQTYGIDEYRIKYIHGKANRGDPLILGHHDNSHFSRPVDTSKMSDEKYENYLDHIQSIDIREMEANEYIERYFRRTYKDTEAIIRANSDFFENLPGIQAVNILGHSLSYIDMDYFITVRNHVGNNCLWNISCYSPEDYRKVKIFVSYLNISDYKLITI